MGRLQQTMAMRAKMLSLPKREHDNDDNENTGDDESDLELEPTVPKASTQKVAVPKTSKKVHEILTKQNLTNLNNSILTQLNYYIIISKLLYYYIRCNANAPSRLHLQGANAI